MSIEAEIVRRIARAKQSTVAADADMDVSVVNRIVSGAMGLKLEHLEKFLTAIGLRVVDLDATTVDRDELDALRALALRYLNKEASNG